MTNPFSVPASFSPGDLAPALLASGAGERSTSLPLLEQAIAVEIVYARQLDLQPITSADEAAWHQAQTVYQLVHPMTRASLSWCGPFTRFVLERHGYSLHRYMARQLSPEAWSCWFAQGGILMPFR